ncbi:hypothetical protein BTA51_09585 [Hahella sp. CCB-MM4]|uniref:hypothetical protein n=1 Tax=Hahella sp. (strain CCB-MM4) TaxID=1926491 RepID=UPI000B9AE0EB|nr:hypothetical protein [Hahella sp. CCB-MM4]OZG74017.1 hypothetical protein BTA51_09585 [Hahella sp. CCB-MM4]
MTVSEVLSQQFDRTAHFVDSLRSKYAKAYSKALESGRETLKEAGELSSKIEPRMRDFASTQWNQAQTFMGDINRGLAEKSIPEDRRCHIVNHRLQRKAEEAIKEGGTE